MALSQGVTAKANVSGAGTATTAGLNTTAGSGISIIVTATQSTNPTVTDSLNGATGWSLVGTSVQISSTPGYVFHFKNEGGSRGTGQTFSVAGTDITMLLVEVVGTNPVVDVQTSNLDSTSPYDSNAITPTVADFMLVAGVGTDTGPTSWTAGASFTKQQEETNAGLYWPAASATRIVTGGSGSYNSSWTAGAALTQVGHVIAAWKESGAAATADQEGFRFRNDDGSETSATWAASQDTDKTAPLATNLRLRMLVNATLDLASAAFTLRYQKNGAGGYVAVPVGATVPEVYGTVTFGAIGTGANGTTTVAPSYPTGITAGQYLVCVITSGGTGSPTPSTPSGWTLLATGASTDGTFGIDTGPRRVTVFGKEAVGTESGTLTVSITSGDTCRGTISRFTKSGSGTWTIEAQGGDDSTSGTGFSATLASMNWNTGDAVLVAVGQRVDTVTQSAQSLTATGVTFGTRTNRASTAVTTGNDHRHVIDTFAAISGTSNVNAAPTWAYTGSAACSGGVVIVRLREYTAPVTNEVYVAASANVTAGGEATTAQLTAPSGKSTSDFVTGRMWDDENGTDSIDITTDDYTELEWCLQAQSPSVDGDYFDFRVYAGASALDSYTLTPRWTLGSGGGASSSIGPFIQSLARRYAPLQFF